MQIHRRLTGDTCYDLTKPEPSQPLQPEDGASRADAVDDGTDAAPPPAELTLDERLHYVQPPAWSRAVPSPDEPGLAGAVGRYRRSVHPDPGPRAFALHLVGLLRQQLYEWAGLPRLVHQPRPLAQAEALSRRLAERMAQTLAPLSLPATHVLNAFFVPIEGPEGACVGWMALRERGELAAAYILPELASCGLSTGCELTLAVLPDGSALKCNGPDFHVQDRQGLRRLPTTADYAALAPRGAADVPLRDSILHNEDPKAVAGDALFLLTPSMIARWLGVAPYDSVVAWSQTADARKLATVLRHAANRMDYGVAMLRAGVPLRQLQADRWVRTDTHDERAALLIGLLKAGCVQTCTELLDAGMLDGPATGLFASTQRSRYDADPASFAFWLGCDEKFVQKLADHGWEMALLSCTMSEAPVTLVDALIDRGDSERLQTLWQGHGLVVDDGLLMRVATHLRSQQHEALMAWLVERASARPAMDRAIEDPRHPRHWLQPSHECGDHNVLSLAVRDGNVGLARVICAHLSTRYGTALRDLMQQKYGRPPRTLTNIANDKRDAAMLAVLMRYDPAFALRSKAADRH